MHGVNLDLLRQAPRSPHAHHRAEHLATLRAARRQRWTAALNRLAARVAPKSHAIMSAPSR